MPELPEVETVRAGLAGLIIGRMVEDAWRRNCDLRYPFPPGFPSALRGALITAVGRRGKYLLISLGDGRMLAWHLGMTGQFHVLPAIAPAGRHEHVCIRFDDGSSLRYRDARRFGYVGLLHSGDWQGHAWFARMGAEPLSAGFDAQALGRCCRGRSAPIKNVIMDGHVVAGIGNIYACEALHAAGIHPRRAAGRISGPRLERLVTSIRDVLCAAIEAGGSTISDFVQADGRPGMFAHRLAVYGREGERCGRCGRPVRLIRLAGRSTYYCAGCQY